MSAKLGFAAGLAVGVLAGSRAGRGLYDRSAAAASAVVHDRRVRSGASAALHRAGSAGSTVAGAAARKVTGKGRVEKKGEEGSGGGGEGDMGRGRGRSGGGRGRIGESVGGADGGVQSRVRMKRLMGGVRSHRHGGGDGDGEGSGGARGHGGGRHWGHSALSNHSHVGVSAPSVQVRPKGDAEGLKDEGRGVGGGGED